MTKFKKINIVHNNWHVQLFSSNTSSSSRSDHRYFSIIPSRFVHGFDGLHEFLKYNKI